PAAFPPRRPPSTAGPRAVAWSGPLLRSFPAAPDRGDVVEARTARRVPVGEPAVRDLSIAGAAHELPCCLNQARSAHAGPAVAATGGVADGRPGDVSAERHAPLREIAGTLSRGCHSEALGHEGMRERIGDVDVPEVDVLARESRAADRLLRGDPQAVVEL